MSKVDVAEYVLSLTTTRERATSTAGDLIEESAARGSAWFWWSLARTTVSLVWRELTHAPLQMARLGFGALMIQAMLVPVIIVVGIAGGLFVSFVLDMLGAEDSAVIVGKGFAIAGFTASQLFIGRWLGRRARGRELAACTATILMMKFVAVAIFMTIARVNGIPLGAAELLMNLTAYPQEFFLHMAFLLLGVTWSRRSVRPLAAS